MDRRSFLASFGAALGAFVFGAKPSKHAMTWYAWGADDKGQVANGATPPAFPPVYPPIVSTVPGNAKVYGGIQQGVAVTPAGELYVWGNNNISGNSLFGNQFGSTAPISTATKLTYTDAVNITAAAVDLGEAFWLRSDHTLWAIGLNKGGAFGNGDAVDTYYATPTQVATNVASFVTGGSGGPVTYYIDLSGDVWFTGRYNLGQKGDGTQSATPIRTFTKITALSNVSRIWTSGNHTLALSGSTLSAWGENQWGELGIGNAVTPQLSPVTVTTLPGGAVIADIQTAYPGPYTYALLTDGRLYVTGFGGAGALGLGNGFLDVHSFTQATVGASLTVTALGQSLQATAGFTSSGAVVAGGLYWATGPNDNDQVDPSSFASYETFQNLITFPEPIEAITFIGDNAVFAGRLRRPRAWVFVVG